MVTTPFEGSTDIKALEVLAEEPYDQKFFSQLPKDNTFSYNRNKKAISRFAVFNRIKWAYTFINIVDKDSFNIRIKMQDTLEKQAILLLIQEKREQFLLSLQKFCHSADQDSFILLKKHFKEFEDTLNEAFDESRFQLPSGTLDFLRTLKISIEAELSIKLIIKDLDKIFFPVFACNRVFNTCYEYFKSINRTQFQTKLMESRYKSNQIISMTQDLHPIIQDAGGYCHGISVLGAYQILAFNRFFICNLSIDVQYCQEKMNFLRDNFSLAEKCQNAQYLVENHTNKIIISKFNTNFKATAAASDIVAHKVYWALDQCKEENFAILLVMRKNSNGGHDVGIVVKNNVYYLIDSNSGLFKFDRIDALIEFIAFLMKHYKYSHVFNRYSVENIPEIENCFPLPKALRQNIPNLMKNDFESAQKASCNTKALTFMRDNFYTAYCAAAIIQTAITEKVTGFHLTKNKSH